MFLRALKLLALILLLGPLGAHADNDGPPPAKVKDSEGQKNASTKPKDREKVVVSPEREAAVMTFVKQHHAELGDLLTHLKAKNAKEYERAIRELFRASEQLAQVQERDAKRYEIELQLWKVRSRLQLLAAKSQMGGAESHQEEIKAALAERYDLEVALLDHERRNLTEREEKLEKRIAKTRSNRENALEQQFQTFVSSAKTAETAKPRHPEKPAVKVLDKPGAAVPTSPPPASK